MIHTISPIIKNSNRTWLIHTAALTSICIILSAVAWDYISLKGILPGHMRAVHQINSGMSLHIHFGVHLLSILLHRLSELPIKTAFHITVIFHIILTFLCLNFSLRCLSAIRQQHTQGILYIFVALALMVIAPIGLPGLDEKTYCFSWYNRTTLLWRNPTHTAVQPYAIMAFCYAAIIINHYRNNETPKVRLLAAASTILLLSVLVKPSFALSFIPTMTLIMLSHWSRNKNILRICYVIAPAALLMLAQAYFLFEYNPMGRIRNVYFEPYTIWKRNNIYPLLTLLLATLYPLYIFILRYRHLQYFSIIAAVNFMLACLPYALLKETGDRDFEWGFWYGLQLLFLAATVELHAWWQSKTSKKERYLCYIAVLLFVLHAGFGIARFITLYPPERVSSL